MFSGFPKTPNYLKTPQNYQTTLRPWSLLFLIIRRGGDSELLFRINFFKVSTPCWSEIMCKKYYIECNTIPTLHQISYVQIYN